MAMDVLSSFQAVQPVALQEQITDFLRQQIRSSALPEGTRLPTTQELAKRWGVTITVIQGALGPLVSEGLLLRKPRVGTVVRRRPPGLTRFGLYRISDAAREGADHFSRRLAAVTAAHLAERGLTTELFTDLRPEEQRTEPYPELLHAVRTGRIDAIIACETEPRVHAWLPQLPVPSALYGAPQLPNAVGHDMGQFAHAAIARLVAHGVRSAGLVSVLPIDTIAAEPSPNTPQSLHHGFLAAAAAAGITVCPAWIRTPPSGVFLPERDAERFGYDAIRALWAEEEHPDGIVVFTDLAARGVIMGLLSHSGDGHPPPRLVLHRNTELGLFCPLEAEFLDTNLSELADTLIERIERQHRGESLSWTLIPYTVG